MAEITALIISRETVGGARKLLEMRRANGIEDPLELLLVDLVGAPEQVICGGAGFGLVARGCGAGSWCQEMALGGAD